MEMEMKKKKVRQTEIRGGIPRVKVPETEPTTSLFGKLKVGSNVQRSTPAD
jgi:hypothetical protein